MQTIQIHVKPQYPRGSCKKGGGMLVTPTTSITGFKRATA